MSFLVHRAWSTGCHLIPLLVMLILITWLRWYLSDLFAIRTLKIPFSLRRIWGLQKWPHMIIPPWVCILLCNMILQSPIKDMEYIISSFESAHGHVASFCVLAELWKVFYIGVYTPLLLFRIQQLPVLKDTGLACWRITDKDSNILKKDDPSQLSPASNQLASQQTSKWGHHSPASPNWACQSRNHPNNSHNLENL